MKTPRTSTPILISALRILAHDIKTDDGVANAAIAEAADRLEELEEYIEDLQGYKDDSGFIGGAFAMP